MKTLLEAGADVNTEITGHKVNRPLLNFCIWKREFDLASVVLTYKPRLKNYWDDCPVVDALRAQNLCDDADMEDITKIVTELIEAGTQVQGFY